MSEKSALSKAMDAARERDPDYREVTDIDQIADRFAERLRDILKRAREAQGIGVGELARRLHVSQPTVSGIEAKGSNVRARTLGRYAAALGADPDTIADANEAGFERALGHGVRSFEDPSTGRTPKRVGGITLGQEATLSDAELRQVGRVVVREISETLARHESQGASDAGQDEGRSRDRSTSSDRRS